MVFIGALLRTQNATRSAWIEPISRRSGLAALAFATSKILAMPRSASPRPTSGISVNSPAVGCTRALKLPFSLSTLAMAEPVVWLSVPGCMVATP